MCALKKILATGEAIQAAMKEAEAYRRFRHPNIIKILDSAVVQEGDGKIVYLWVIWAAAKSGFYHSTPRGTFKML